ncbi:MAG: methionyl-tRNA formyltransferase, partial [Acidobacteria bacterium]|nr:methionyl-tRNA formyltransferase [Acidobacteriota bacterium]
MRVVFMGTPEFAVPTLEGLCASSHEVVHVITQPDRPKGRGQKLQPTPVKVVAQAHGLPVSQPDTLKGEAVVDLVRASGADIGVVAAYGRIIPERLIQAPRFGMINVHASLLPRWRGAAPIQRAVIAGDPETGVTIMRVVKAL